MGDILNLEKPMAPRLIKCLYLIALVLITLGTIRGVVMGALMIAHPPQPFSRALPPPPPDAAPGDAAAPSTAPQAEPAPPPPRPFLRDGRRMGPGMMRDRMMRDRRGMMGEGFMMRRVGPQGAGALRIVGALLRGLVMILILRVLAEMGLAVIQANNRLGKLTDGRAI